MEISKPGRGSPSHLIIPVINELDAVCALRMLKTPVPPLLPPLRAGFLIDGDQFPGRGLRSIRPSTLSGRIRNNERLRNFGFSSPRTDIEVQTISPPPSEEAQHPA